MIHDEAALSGLAEKAQRGDKQAYAEMLSAARDWLRRYFGRKLPPEKIDDLVQETLISIHRKLATYDPARPIYPWLAALARYRFVDYLRSAYRTVPSIELNENLAGGPCPEEAVSARVSLDRLMAALPVAQQQVIELVKIEGLSILEAARRTGQSESLVKVNIHRGLKRLAALIESS